MKTLLLLVAILSTITNKSTAGRLQCFGKLCGSLAVKEDHHVLPDTHQSHSSLNAEVPAVVHEEENQGEEVFASSVAPTVSIRDGTSDIASREEVEQIDEGEESEGEETGQVEEEAEEEAEEEEDADMQGPIGFGSFIPVEDGSEEQNDIIEDGDIQINAVDEKPDEWRRKEFEEFVKTRNIQSFDLFKEQQKRQVFEDYLINCAHRLNSIEAQAYFSENGRDGRFRVFQSNEEEEEGGTKVLIKAEQFMKSPRKLLINWKVIDPVLKGTIKDHYLSVYIAGASGKRHFLIRNSNIGDLNSGKLLKLSIPPQLIRFLYRVDFNEKQRIIDDIEGWPSEFSITSAGKDTDSLDLEGEGEDEDAGVSWAESAALFIELERKFAPRKQGEVYISIGHLRIPFSDLKFSFHSPNDYYDGLTGQYLYDLDKSRGRSFYEYARLPENKQLSMVPYYPLYFS